MEIAFREAERWLRQAEYELKAARWVEEGGFYAPACFLAQQSAAKSLRAFLFYKKEDARESRSVADLVDRALTYDERFKPLDESLSRLDIYYKTTRYPDSLPGGIPAEIITARDSKEAISIASELLSIVEDTRKGYMPESF